MVGGRVVADLLNGLGDVLLRVGERVEIGEQNFVDVRRRAGELRVEDGLVVDQLLLAGRVRRLTLLFGHCGEDLLQTTGRIQTPIKATRKRC